MNAPIEIETPRLVLRTASPEELRASVQSAHALAHAAGFDVAPDWPPRYWDAPAVEWLLDTLTREPSEPLWRAWLVRLRGGAIVGTAGCKGPPGEDGAVEIGYGVVTSHWRRGIASEAAGGLIRWLARDARVTLLRAHTLTGDPASAGVLLKNGFRLVATIEDPTDGKIDRFERGVL